MLPGMMREAMAAGAAPAATKLVAAAAPSAGATGGVDFGDLSAIAADPKAIVRAIAQSAGYTLAEAGDAWKVTVPIGTFSQPRGQ